MILTKLQQTKGENKAKLKKLKRHRLLQVGFDSAEYMGGLPWTA